MKLTCEIEYRAANLGDPVPWYYRLFDAENNVVSEGWAHSRERARERAREDAAMIRERVTEDTEAEQFEL